MATSTFHQGKPQWRGCLGHWYSWLLAVWNSSLRRLLPIPYGYSRDTFLYSKTASIIHLTTGLISWGLKLTEIQLMFESWKIKKTHKGVKVKWNECNIYQHPSIAWSVYRILGFLDPKPPVNLQSMPSRPQSSNSPFVTQLHLGIHLSLDLAIVRDLVWIKRMVQPHGWTQSRISQ